MLTNLVQVEETTEVHESRIKLLAIFDNLSKV